LPDFEFVTDHILRLELEAFSFGPYSLPVCIWLVRVSDHWVLVDSGSAGASQQVLNAIRKVTGDRGPQTILLTHGHLDHAGGLSGLRVAWNPPFFCHVEEAPFLAGEIDYGQQKAGHLGFLFVKPFFPRTKVGSVISGTFERGQTVEGMAVIHLPGHTPGHVGFYHPKDNALICGDTVMNLGRQLSLPFAVVTPDLELAQHSVLRLSELDFAHLLPSHGEPILNVGREAILDFVGDRQVAYKDEEWGL
jgi:glyoxylase-like metal-dependent hydrolase (beta-lactamase superfamily II)